MLGRRFILGFYGEMEKNMETTGIIGVIEGLYREAGKLSEGASCKRRWNRSSKLCTLWQPWVGRMVRCFLTLDPKPLEMHPSAVGGQG